MLGIRRNRSLIMSIKIAIGLGNSGAVYALTRHNAGVIVLKEIADKFGAGFSRNKYCNAQIAKCDIGGKPFILAFAEGYMNLSGENMKMILKFFKLDASEALVIHDDIGFEAGRMKISAGGSSGGHNGISDIIKNCGNEFVRLRIGIGAKTISGMDLADHVLGALSASDIAAIKALPAAECLKTAVEKGVEVAQNLYNRREKEPRKESESDGQTENQNI